MSNCCSSSGMMEFQNCVESSNLLYVVQFGPSFTWSNNSKGGHLVMERFDRVFCNLQWLNHFPHSHSTALAIAASDHCPIIFSTDGYYHMQKFRKFEAYWYHCPDCSKIISECWQQQASGSSSFQVHSKLARTLSTLLNWSKTHIGNLSYRIFVEEQKLLKLNEALPVNTQPSPLLETEIGNTKHMLEFLYDCEASFWAQRAKIDWQTNDERNTKYFHTIANNRRAGNNICCLMNPDENWTENADELIQMTYMHFSNVFQSEDSMSFDDILNDLTH
ncbi:hypothetical protein K1719_010797 [Acacia pycnantha]|nr:hypothetical protein K1719_010797 [Acacia pycnantha]